MGCRNFLVYRWRQLPFPYSGSSFQMYLDLAGLEQIKFILELKLRPLGQVVKELPHLSQQSYSFCFQEFVEFQLRFLLALEYPSF